MSTEIVNAVNGVKTKRIHVIFGQPVQGIVDHPAAHAIALRPIKVDGLAPGRVISIGETRSKLGKIIPFRTEVVVDNVHHHRESVSMAGVDKSLQAGGAAVGRWWRVEAGAVVSPVAISGKLGDRHNLDCGDTEIAKIWKSRNDAFECALGRESAGVEFVDDEVFQRNAGP